MESQEQSESQICRVIVLGREGTEVLLKIPEAGFAFLPSKFHAGSAWPKI